METVFCWHIHHAILLEPLTKPIEKRIEYIKAEKPAGEIDLRLRLLKPVVGQLPAAVVEAWAACDQAWAARDHALQANQAAINALHAKECPDCPWDGKTIFP